MTQNRDDDIANGGRKPAWWNERPAVSDSGVLGERRPRVCAAGLRHPPPAKGTRMCRGQLPKCSQPHHFTSSIACLIGLLCRLPAPIHLRRELTCSALCGLQVAIKYIDRRGLQGYHKYVLRETLNHQQLSLCKHPHIVEFYEVWGGLSCGS